MQQQKINNQRIKYSQSEQQFEAERILNSRIVIAYWKGKAYGIIVL